MKRIGTNQKGFASTIISIVIIAVLSLIAVSFALLMRREQRQALDRQLNTQAFYAAETGVNDAINAITKAGFTNDITDCRNTQQISPGGQGSGSNTLDTTSGIEYTCVLVDQSPGTLEYAGLNTISSNIIRLQAAGGVPITSVKISWQDSDYNASSGTHTAFAENNDSYFLPQSQYMQDNPTLFPANGGSIVRATLMPVPGGASRDTLINMAQTVFLYPRPGNAGQIGTQNYQTGGADGNGAFVNGNCNVANIGGDYPKQCNAEITNISGANIFYLRLKPVYNNADVTITAFSNGQPVELVGEQAMIDSTGKANDVLRRIQVRVPLRTSYFMPEFAIESLGTWCKRLAVYPSNDPALGADVVALPGNVDYDGNRSNPVECTPN